MKEIRRRIVPSAVRAVEQECVPQDLPVSPVRLRHELGTIDSVRGAYQMPAWINAAFAPSSFALMAAPKPPAPQPMTIRSCSGTGPQRGSLLKYTTSQPASGQNRYSRPERRRKAFSVNSAFTVSRSTTDPADPFVGQRLAPASSVFPGPQQLDITLLHSSVAPGARTRVKRFLFDRQKN
jgi:hypothetical protein